MGLKLRNKIILILFIFISGCAAPGMQRAVVFDADNSQIVAAEFPNGSTIKFDGPVGKLEVIAPAPKPSFAEDVAKGMSAAMVPLMPIMMINAMDD